MLDGDIYEPSVFNGEFTSINEHKFKCTTCMKQCFSKTNKYLIFGEIQFMKNKILLILIAWTTIGNAQLLKENFTTHTAGANLAGTNGWSQCSSSTLQVPVSSRNLTYPNYASTNTSNSLYINSAGGTGYGGYCKTFTGVNSGSVYVSYLFRDSVLAATSWSGQYLVTLGSGAFSNALSMYFTSTSGGYQLGVRKATNTETYATTALSPGQTNLIVMKYTFNTGSTSDDVVSLFINPNPLAAEPTPSATTSAGSDFTGSINNLLIRLNQLSGQTPDGFLDAFTVDTTWSKLFSSNPCPNPPVVNLGADTIQCGGSVTLNAGNVGATYLWSGGSSAQTLNVTTSGTYSVVVTDGSGCKGTDSINVTIHPKPIVTLGQDTATCAPNSIVLNAGNAGSTYSWSNAATTQTTTITTTAIVSITVTTPAGCKGKDTISVTIHPLPVVSFTLPKDTVCVNEGALNLSGTPAGGTYSGTGVSGTAFNPATAGVGSHTITYTVVNANTCVGTANDVVVVKSVCTGINEIEQLKTTIYPSPASSIINIKGINTNRNVLTAEIFDVQGKVVMQGTLNLLNNEYQLNINKLVAGVYTVSIITENGNYIGRFTKE